MLQHTGSGKREGTGKESSQKHRREDYLAAYGFTLLEECILLGTAHVRNDVLGTSRIVLEAEEQRKLVSC